MIKHARALVFGLAFLATVQVATPSAAAAASGTIATAATRNARIEAAVEDAVRRAVVPGAAVGVAKDGRIEFVRGFGVADLETRAPVDAEGVFRLGSISKQFTAAGILLLAERGQVNIDDKLSKYYPEFPKADKVTLRQMLGHTSGINNIASDPVVGRMLVERFDLRSDDIVYLIDRQDKPYLFEPGESWSYSNSGYYILGTIIEKVSGQSLGNFLKTNFFDPLAMNDTRLENRAEIVPHRVKGYMNVDGHIENEPYYTATRSGGAGGLRSTAADLLKWSTALFGGKVLKPETFAQMISPVHLNDGRTSSAIRAPEGEGRPSVDYGMGLRTGTWFGRKYIGHEGLILGFNSALYTFPDQNVTIVVLTNYDSGAPPIFWKVAEAYFGGVPNSTTP